MVKKISLFISCLIVLLVISGCWDYKEIRDYTNVAGVAIDVGEEKKLKLTFECIIFEASADFKINILLADAEGNTTYEAIRAAIQATNKKLFFGQCKVIVISEELAKQGIRWLLDSFGRDYELRLNVLVFIAKGGKASDMFKQEGMESQISSYNMEELVLEDEENTSHSHHKELYQIYQDLYSDKVDLTLPALEQKQVGEVKTFTSAGLARFKDDRFVNIMDAEMVIFYLMLCNRLEGGVVSVPYENDSYLALVILSAKTLFEISEEKSKIKLKLTTNLKTGFGENGKEELDQTMTLAKAGKLAEPFIKMKMEESLQNCLDEVYSDIWGYEKLIWQRKYNIWKKYEGKSDNFLDHLEISIQVKVEVRDSGMAKP